VGVGDPPHRHTTSLQHCRRRRHTDQRNGEYGDETMH
jgi:hypothetical protein